jgi:hypothetical protein
MQRGDALYKEKKHDEANRNPLSLRAYALQLERDVPCSVTLVQDSR